MADLYSVLPGLQPTAQDVLEAELLAKQILEAKYPTLDLREGTGLRDLLIRPLAVFVALAKGGTDYLFTQNRLSDVDDATPPDLVDSILSNWFLTRKIGTRSVISARLYFSRRKNVSISTDIYFSTDNTLKFYPAESTSHISESLVFDSFSNEYYVDVDLIAEKEGATYNIGSGSLLYFSNFDPYFLRAEINYLKESSVESESNTEFVNRAKTAISTRNLINEPSIDSNLKETFNYIKRLVTVGMGNRDMIRDQIKAVFDPEPSRVADSLTSSGTTATLTLQNHGYHSGQLVNITSASPVEYNGEHGITVIDTDVFTYEMDSTAGSVVSLPNVISVTKPLLIHNGGMVDVYCSSSLASAIVQVTLDDKAEAHLTGPIYEVTRSSLSGGIEDDTVPVINSVPIISFSISGSVVTATTNSPNNFTDSRISQITISGVVQERAITAISCTGTTVTATSNAHNYIVGDTAIITGVTPDEYNGEFPITATTANTFSYVVPANISEIGTGTMLVDVDMINGTWTIGAKSESYVSFDIGRTASNILTQPATASAIVPHSTRATNLQSSVASASCTDTTVTVTLPFHGQSEGRYITISGGSNTSYRGSWRVTEVINQDQFTFEVPSNIASPTTGADISYVVPWQDHGFSQKQDMTVNMPSGYAGKTASFEIKYFQNLDSIQEYLDSSANRVVCGDYLARGFNFYNLDVTITSYNSVAPNSSLVNEVITNYVDSLEPGAMFVVSDMVSQLRLNGIVNIQNPPEITFRKYTRDLTPVETGVITDILDPNDSTNVFLINAVSTKSINIDPNTLVIN